MIIFLLHKVRFQIFMVVSPGFCSYTGKTGSWKRLCTCGIFYGWQVTWLLTLFGYFLYYHSFRHWCKFAVNNEVWAKFESSTLYHSELCIRAQRVWRKFLDSALIIEIKGHRKVCTFSNDKFSGFAYCLVTFYIPCHFFRPQCKFIVSNEVWKKVESSVSCKQELCIKVEHVSHPKIIGWHVKRNA